MYKTYEELSAPQEKNRDLYSVEEINDINHKRDILSRNAVVCVDVYANWCGPCKQTEPSYSLLASQYNEPGKCAVVKENYEKKLSDGVGALPTYIFYVGGRRMEDEIVGADLAKVEEKLNYYRQNASQMLRQQGQPPQRQQQPQPYQSQFQAPPGFQAVNPQESHGPNAGKNIRNYRPNQPVQQGSGQPYQTQQSYHQPYQ
jgi:thioredoxin 1